MRFLSRRRQTNSPSQTRPPPAPRSHTSAQYSRSLDQQSATPMRSTFSSRVSFTGEFNDARQRWSELARERRSGLSLASDEMDNAAASIDSINLGDHGIRHVCTPPASDFSPSAAIDPRTSSENAAALPTRTDRSPTSYFRPPPTAPPAPPPDTTTPTTSPSPSRPSLSDYGHSPGPLSFKVDYAELSALKQKFNQLDAEGKGFLRRSQFYDLFSSIIDSTDAPTPHHTPMFNFAYSLFHSSDERLNLKEFVTGMSVLTKGTEQDRLRYLFTMYDKDSSGRLSADEIKQVFRVMGSYAASHDFRASDSLDSQSLSSLKTINPSVLDDLVLKTLHEHDLDGDGLIGFDDFVKWCARDPVVKTWMDTLCYDTARGVARLRGESEKELLELLGFDDNHFWPTFGDGINSTGVQSSTSTSASHSALLPPTNAIIQSDSSSEVDVSGHAMLSDAMALAGQTTSSTTQSMTLTAIGSFEIDFRTLVFEKQIGSGSFAVVWKCKWLDSPVAVKVFKSGPRLVLNSDGTPCVTSTSSVSVTGSGSAVASVSNVAVMNSVGRGYMENGESFEPEFDSMMNGGNQGLGMGPSMFEDDFGCEMTNNRARFLQEVSLLKSIRHPNLLLYMGACVNPLYPLCIVSELIDGGSLFELLHGHGQVRLSIRQKLLLTQDIARGMLYLHGRDPIVLHRDLKSANILVELQNDESFKGTIIDFGLSKFSSTQASLVPGHGRGLTGSLVTMAPEVMNEQSYEPRSDVYSYAIVCWELWCGRIPFGKVIGATQLMMKVAVQGERPQFEKDDLVPMAIQKLIRACWDQDVSKRPDFLVIVKMLNEIRHDLNLGDG